MRGIFLANRAFVNHAQQKGIRDRPLRHSLGCVANDADRAAETQTCMATPLATLLKS